MSIENTSRGIVPKLKEQGPKLIATGMGLGLIVTALLPIAVEAQSPVCTDEQKQAVNVVRGNGKDGIIDIFDLTVIGNTVPLDIGLLSLAANSCYGQVVEEDCPEPGTKIFPACGPGLEKCGPLNGLATQPLFPYPGEEFGAGANTLLPVGGIIEKGGDLDIYKIKIGDKSWCRAVSLIGTHRGYLPRDRFHR